MMIKGILLAAILAGSALLGVSAGAQTKTLAERLGYKATDKLLIIHADDAGMCHSVNVATINAMEHGCVTCASIMVPCPWMPEIAAYCRQHPDADFGIHLTLTSEWKYYRWRPVTPIDQAPGLVDKQGFMHNDVAGVMFNAKPDEVAREIQAQIDRARQFGIQPTHVDSHMGTLFTRPFFPAYVGVSKKNGVMPMLPGPTPARIAQSKLLGVDIQKTYEDLSKQGYVFLDLLNESAKGDTLEARREFYYNFFRNLKPGVTQIIVHLSLDDEEVKHIMGAWKARWNEYQIFTDPKTKELLDQLGIKLIGYKQLAPLAFKAQ